MKFREPESMKRRPTAGRVEDQATLDERLLEGLEYSFPCSNPISVTNAADQRLPEERQR